MERQDEPMTKKRRAVPMAMVEMMRTKTLEGRSAGVRRTGEENSLNLLSKRRLGSLLATCQGSNLSDECAAREDEQM